MKKLTIEDVSKEDWIIMRLLCQIMRERNESKRWYLDTDVVRTLVYIGKKYPDGVVAEAALLLREERNRGK
jgi:hypothetical protein